MSHIVNKTPLALADLGDIAEYLQKMQDERLALRFLDAAEKTFTKLAQMPTIGAVFQSEKLSEAIRTRLVKGFEKYVIIYRQIPDGIEVIRVLHTSRQWKKLFEEEA
jgi:toxin ParE1/3/4